MIRIHPDSVLRLSFGGALILFSSISAQAATSATSPASPPSPAPPASQAAPRSPKAASGPSGGAAKSLLGRLNQADAIVVGKATGLKPGTVEEAPVSLVTLAVSQIIRGKVAPEIEIVVPRTLIKSGGILMETGSLDQPLLGVGDEVLLFLSRYPDRDNSFSIASAGAGKFLVTTTPEGDRRADRYLLEGPVTGGVPLSTLITQIRLELKIPDEKAADPKPR